MPFGLLGSFHHQIDGRGEAAPVGGFLLELRATAGGQRIELGFSSRFRFRPFRFDPGFLFQAVQSGVEGALLNLKNFAGDLLNALGNGPAVFGFEGNGLENEEVESALDEIAWLTHTMTIYIKKCR